MLSWALLFGAATAASPEFSAWAKEFGKLYKDEAKTAEAVPSSRGFFSVTDFA